ncbi:MAG: DUF427 domain-containing protein [Pseudomonadota bacterium]
MSDTLKPSPAVVEHRAAWHYRGQERPPFADPVEPGLESVWDYPRPPALEEVALPLRVVYGGVELARTERGKRVCETASAATYYFPPEDVAVELLERTGGRSHCEWKGIADEYAGQDRIVLAWAYNEVYPEFAVLKGWFAFYPRAADCYIGEEKVGSQPGGYYGGWVSANLAGPIKGGPGSNGW